jgi:hypothetical protein
MAVAVVVSTAAVSAVDFTGEASAVALSTAVAVSTAMAFVAGVSAVAVSTAAAFVAGVLVAATGVATGAITDSLMMSSSATSAFRHGGVTRTDITVTATTITHTITMAMEPDTDTDRTVTMVGPVTDTVMAADQGISGLCGVGDMPGYGSLKYRRPVGV